MKSAVKVAEQTYTLADVARLLRIQPERVSALVEERQFPPAQIYIPGGGQKGRRWLASQLDEALARWDVTTRLPPSSA